MEAEKGPLRRLVSLVCRTSFRIHLGTVRVRIASWIGGRIPETLMRRPPSSIWLLLGESETKHIAMATGLFTIYLQPKGSKVPKCRILGFRSLESGIWFWADKFCVGTWTLRVQGSFNEAPHQQPNTSCSVPQSQIPPPAIHPTPKKTAQISSA